MRQRLTARNTRRCGRSMDGIGRRRRSGSISPQHILDAQRGARRQARVHRRRGDAHLRRTRRARAGGRRRVAARWDCGAKSACSCACTTPSTSPSRSWARCTRASCRSRSTRCSPRTTTRTCSRTAARRRCSCPARCCPRLQQALARGGTTCARHRVACRRRRCRRGAREFCSVAGDRRGRMPAAADTAADDMAFWLYSSGLHRAAEGDRAHARQPALDRGALRQAGPRARRARRRVLGGQALLCVRPRQRAHVSAVGGRHDDPDGRARRRRRRCSSGCVERKPTIFFGVPTLYAAMLVVARTAAARGRRAAPVRLRGRGAAARSRRALRRALRLRRPGRHRLDRDAAHLPVQPAGRRALRHDRHARARLRRRAARRRRPAGRRRRDRRPLHPRPEAALMYWENREQYARDVPGRVDEERRQVHARRRRLLHVRRPQRRHAEGERPVRVAVRGRGRADAARRGARGGGRRQGRRRRTHADARLRRAEVRARAATRRWPRR